MTFIVIHRQRFNLKKTNYRVIGFFFLSGFSYNSMINARVFYFYSNAENYHTISFGNTDKGIDLTSPSR